MIVPKVELPGDLAFVERLLDGTEAVSKRRDPLRVQALVETAAGLSAVDDFAGASPRLEGLVLGYADLAVSLGRSRAGVAGLDRWGPARERIWSPPWCEDLKVGDTFDAAPALTLTEGQAAVHQAIVGDRRRICLATSSVSGSLAHQARSPTRSSSATSRSAGRQWPPAVSWRTSSIEVCNCAARPGWATRCTPAQRSWPCAPHEDRPSQHRPGRAAHPHRRPTRPPDPRLLAVCDVSAERRSARHRSRRRLELDSIRAPLERPAKPRDVLGLDAIRRVTPSGLGGEHLRAGTTWRVDDGDVVTCAPELAWLTLNVAAVHHDSKRSGENRRLVYGGHTIGIAAAHAARMLRRLVYVMAWHSCEHLGPVGEGDTLVSEIEVELERTEPLDGGGVLAHLRSRVAARREAQAVPVLDWRCVAAVA